MNSKYPAFPTGHNYDDVFHEQYIGMSKREYFAIMALQGLLSNPGGPVNILDDTMTAINAADELLNRLNKETK